MFLPSCFSQPQVGHPWAFTHDFTLVVAAEGPDVLYTGRYAMQLASDIQAAGALFMVCSL